MEVRCDHCQSECKLDEGATPGSRTSVKCNDCGHIIVLEPKTPAPEGPKNGPATPPPDVVEWLVETSNGRSLRSPDLATLHRWIIERRVTREDRISRDGKSWQRVGELPDLVPFFDIVDSAERARRADTPGPTMLPAPPPMAAPSAQSPPVVLDRGAFPEVEDRTETKVVRTPPAHVPLPLKLVLTMVVAALVAFAGISLYNYRAGPRATAPIAVVSVPAPSPPPTEPEPPEVAPLPAADETQAPDDSEPSGLADEPVASPEERPSVAPSRRRARGGGRAAAGRAAKAASRHPTPTPSGTASGAPQAMAAQGYAAFNRRRFSQAITLFKQALAGNPSNGTALFGLAEAYRETGQKAQALKCYRRYIQILPSGPDAGSARLQIRLLESKR
jgi:predicted Zn finger-like uncharacterized protein